MLGVRVERRKEGQVWMTGYLETRINLRMEEVRIWETKRGIKPEAKE